VTSPSPWPDLTHVAAEIEDHVGRSGWDRGPTLFALVPTARVLDEDPDAAALIGAQPGEHDLTPIEQEELPDGSLDEVLAQIGWPAAVAGCAVSQEILVLPPSAEQELAEPVRATEAARHPERREARLVVAVLRDGGTGSVLRLRATDGDADELLTGADLAPNLAAALRATLED
jgi:hypothetical protein